MGNKIFALLMAIAIIGVVVSVYQFFKAEWARPVYPPSPLVLIGVGGQHDTSVWRDVDRHVICYRIGDSLSCVKD